MSLLHEQHCESAHTGHQQHSSASTSSVSTRSSSASSGSIRSSSAAQWLGRLLEGAGGSVTGAKGKAAAGYRPSGESVSEPHQLLSAARLLQSVPVVSVALGPVSNWCMCNSNNCLYSDSKRV